MADIGGMLQIRESISAAAAERRWEVGVAIELRYISKVERSGSGDGSGSLAMGKWVR